MPVYRNPWPVEGEFTNATTSAVDGTAFVPFSDEACDALAVVNNTASTVEIRRNGTGSTMQILAGAAYLVTGIRNANQVSVKRTDEVATAIVVHGDAFRY